MSDKNRIYVFIGAIWDLYKLLNETVKDGDGFPLYSGSSMKGNYHRRVVQSASTIKAVVALLFGLSMLMGFVSGIYGMNQARRQEKQEVTQEKNDTGQEKKTKDETVDENLSELKIEMARFR